MSTDVLMIVGSGLGVAMLTILAASLIWVYRDTQARDKTGCAWLLIAFFTWPVGLLLYALLRNRMEETNGQTEEGAEPGTETGQPLRDRVWAAISWIPLTPLWPIPALLALALRSTRKRPFIRYNAILSIVMGVTFILLTIVIFGLIALVYLNYFYQPGKSQPIQIPGVVWFLPFFYWAYRAFRGKTVKIPLVSNWIEQRGWGVRFNPEAKNTK